MYTINHSVKELWRNTSMLLLLFLVGVIAACAATTPAKQKAVLQEISTEENVIEKITLSEDEGSASISINGKHPLAYTAVKQFSPLGVILYFPKTVFKGVEKTYSPESTIVEKIVTSEIKGTALPARGTQTGPSSRIEIHLKKDVSYQVTRHENQLLVEFKKASAESTSPAPGLRVTAGQKTAVTDAPAPKEKTGAVRLEPQLHVQQTTKKSEKPAWVNRIDFEMMKAGRSRIVVGTTRKVKYEVTRPSNKRLLLKLFHVRLPKSQKRPLITTRFKSAVDRIVPVQTPKMGDTAVIAVELRQAVPYRVEQKENLCFLHFDASNIPPKPMPEMERPRWVQVMKETEETITEKVKARKEKPVVTKTGKVYTGQKISLDFQNADIQNVFRILHEISGQNFVIGEDVQGRVTLKLEKVPWDQVLDLILKMNKLGTVVEGNVVRIATLKSLAAEQKAVQAKAKAEERAKKAKKKLEPLITEYIPINYSDAAAIEKHLEEIKSARGKISLDERTNMIIMEDVKASIDKAKELVKRLDIETPQVLIQARIVEASTTFSRDIGVQWGGVHQTLRGSGHLGGYYGFSGQAGDNYLVNLPPEGPTSGIGFTFTRFSGGLTSLALDARLLAMESTGEGKILSSPKVTTLHKEKAHIEQGFHYKVKVGIGDNLSLEDIDATLSLDVTPQVSADNRIMLEIEVAKKRADFAKAVDGIPAIDEKKASTKVLLDDGETIVIGGIMTENKEWSEKGVPWLSKVPGLEWLFSSKLKKSEKNELLIFITPKIIKSNQRSLQ